MRLAKQIHKHKTRECYLYKELVKVTGLSYNED